MLGLIFFRNLSILSVNLVSITHWNKYLLNISLLHVRNRSCCAWKNIQDATFCSNGFYGHSSSIFRAFSLHVFYLKVKKVSVKFRNTMMDVMCIWKHLFLILAVLHSIYFDISTEVLILLFDLLSVRITPSQPSTTFLTYFLTFLPTLQAD